MRRLKGFTLIELSLSMAFIAILSLTVAYIINDTVASYRKGITLKQVNTVGIGLVDDLRAAIQNSSAKSVTDDCSVVYGDIYKDGGRDAGSKCETDGARNFVTVTRKATVKGRSGSDTLSDVPVFGAFCTGDYSYIWNSGYFFNKETNAYKVEGLNSASFVFKANSNVVADSICKKSSGGKMTCSNFRLLKVVDKSRAVCISVAGSNYNPSEVGPVFNIVGSVSEVVTEQPVDLLGSDEQNGGLALYDFYVSTPAESTTKNNLFYSVSFVLGTVQGGINIKKTGGLCAAPDDWQVENFDYCAINKFNFAVQATGG